MEQRFSDALRSCFKSSNLMVDEPMSRHTTFRVGGCASYVVEIGCLDDLVGGLQLCKKNQIPWVVIGNGSNLLVSDKGYQGCVFLLASHFSKIEVQGDKMKIQAGALMANVGKVALCNHLTGFEFAAGIPGSMGGGTYMNAGAYGGELKDIITEVTILTKDGECKVCSAQELSLEYRHTSFMESEDIVLETCIQLEQGKSEDIQQKMNELMKKRREKQPLEYPSGGSTFKRPQGYFAGKLIQDAGLRGYMVGGAQVSEKHCGFVINRDSATAMDIYMLTENVITIVKDKFGVTMEREIQLLGEF